ncbi:Cut9-interacting protein scn1 [Cladorrhinum sp. PSN259]|nr:Cut9-interacting protein scn1 [Cladorrhinum sp. PSN259]
MCQGSTPARPPLPGEEGQREEFPWQLGAVDAHCHPTDTMAAIANVPAMRARVLTIMATRSQDQDLVAQVAAQRSFSNRAALATPPTEDGSAVTDKIVPAFGWHPWFSHQLYDDTEGGNRTYDPSLASRGVEETVKQKQKHYSAVLTGKPDDAFITSLPDPISLNAFLAETRRRLTEFPLALIGEIGLDKGFRLPVPWTEEEYSKRDHGQTPGGRESRALTKYHVDTGHQVGILKAQLRLAGELGRAVSVHGVQGHGVLYDALASLWKGHEKEFLSKRQQRRIAEGAENFSDLSDASDDDLDVIDNVTDFANQGLRIDKPNKIDPNETEQSKDEKGKGDKQEGSDDKVEIILDAGHKPYEPKPFPPRICLHSFSSEVEQLKRYIKPEIPAKAYFSFSTGVNLLGPTESKSQDMEEKFVKVVKACPDDRILVESDLHIAGEEMDYFLEHMYRKVCNVKGWTLEKGIKQIRRNYEEFIFG